MVQIFFIFLPSFSYVNLRICPSQIRTIPGPARPSGKVSDGKFCDFWFDLIIIAFGFKYLMRRSVVMVSGFLVRFDCLVSVVSV
ncbi:unnamed protein product [Camellia sinensis]